MLLLNHSPNVILSEVLIVLYYPTRLPINWFANITGHLVVSACRVLHRNHALLYYRYQSYSTLLGHHSSCRSMWFPTYYRTRGMDVQQGIDWIRLGSWENTYNSRILESHVSCISYNTISMNFINYLVTVLNVGSLRACPLGRFLCRDLHYSRKFFSWRILNTFDSFLVTQMGDVSVMISVEIPYALTVPDISRHRSRNCPYELYQFRDLPGFGRLVWQVMSISNSLLKIWLL